MLARSLRQESSSLGFREFGWLFLPLSRPAERENMSGKKLVRVEIYEGDPFTGCCGPGRASTAAVDRTRRMLMERNETVKTLREEFKEQVEIEREIISTRRKIDSYPPHVWKRLAGRTKVPFILINGQLVLEGRFPSLEDFRQLVEEHVKNPRQEFPSQ